MCPVLLVCHLAEAATPGLADRAERAAALLSAQPGCRWVEVGRAVDDPAAWVLLARFDSVPAYRRALGPFDVREHVVPLLSLTGQGDGPGERPATFETLLEAVDGEVRRHRSDRAPGGPPERPGGSGDPRAPR